MSSRDEVKILLTQRWSTLAPREQVLVALMGGALAFLLVWMIAVRPAWRTLDQGPAQRVQADIALLQLQALANEAKELRALPPVPQAQAEQALKSATEQLGAKAKLTVQAEKATLTLTGATGEDMLQWLVQARGGAHARPVEAALTRAGDGYNGTLVVAFGQSQ